MPCTQRSVTVTTAGTENLLAGTMFEFAPADSALMFGARADAAGLAITVSRDADVLTEDYNPQVGSGAPVKPDDFPVSGEPVPMGSRVKVKVTNSSGASRTLFYNVCLDEI